MEQNPESSLFEMEFDGTAQHHLNIISKWSKFISISGFSLLGLSTLVVGWIYIKTRSLFQVYLGYLFVNADAKAWLLISLVIVSALLFIVWLIYLLRLSMQFRSAVKNNNTAELGEGFKSLRIFFVVTIANTVLAVLFTIYSLITNPI